MTLKRLFFLSTKIVVMSQRQATVREVIIDDLDRPRDRNSIEFIEMRKKIMSVLDFDILTMSIGLRKSHAKNCFK